MKNFENVYQKIFLANNLEEFVEQPYIEKFYNIYMNLIQTNKLFNLTALTSVEDVIALHFADSLLLYRSLKEIFNVKVTEKTSVNPGKERKSLLDIGSGAGFPALPLAVACQELNVFALDSTEKKMNFVKTVAEKCNINNIFTIVGRAEDLLNTTNFLSNQRKKDDAFTKTMPKKYRHSFDFVTARAVSKLNILAEISLPYLKMNGIFIAMKGANGLLELKEAENAIKELGCHVEDVIETNLVYGNEDNKRVLILIKKVSLLDEKYPRKYSQILKKPL